MRKLVSKHKKIVNFIKKFDLDNNLLKLVSRSSPPGVI